MKERLTKEDDVPFTQVANKLLFTPSLSLKAKGLWAYMYAKPDKWNFSSERIAEDSIDGSDSVLTGLRELEDAGYIKRKRRSDGTMDYHISWKPDREKASQGKSLPGKSPAISNKEAGINKEEEINKEDAKQSFASPLPLIASFFNPSKDKHDNVLMSLDEFILMCRSSTHRFIRLIAEYADDRRPTNTTRGQWREFGRRNMRAAQKLAPYNDRQIAEAMEAMLKDVKSETNPKGFISKWGLETLVKYLDQV